MVYLNYFFFGCPYKFCALGKCLIGLTGSELHRRNSLGPFLAKCESGVLGRYHFTSQCHTFSEKLFVL